MPWFVFPLLILVAVAFLTIQTVSDPDIWFHLALGREFVQHGSLPKTDIFSHTAAGREWISSGWGASVLYYLAFTAGSGPDAFWGPSGGGLVLIVFMAVAAGTLAVHVAALRRGANGGTMALLLLAAMLAASLRFNPRPDVFSQLLMALTALVLSTAPTGRAARRTWILPPLFALWANLHAGFPAGLVVVGIYAAFLAWRWKGGGAPGGPAAIAGRLAPLALCFVTWMANPYGWRLPALAGKIAAIPEVTISVFEWMPLIYFPAYNPPWTAYAGVALLLGIGLAMARKAEVKPEAWQWVAMGLFLALTLYQRRQVGMLAALVPALLVPQAGGLDRLLAARGRWVVPAAVLALTLSICGLKLSGALGSGGPAGPEIGRNCRVLPCASTDFLEANRPPGLMFNSYGIGGYLLYHLGPATKVFIDGRLDVYDHATWRDLLDLQEERLGIDAFTARYNLTTFVVDIREAAKTPGHLAVRLAARPDFRLAYFDDGEAVFVKDGPVAAAYAAAHAYRYCSPFAPDRLSAALRDPAAAPAAVAEIRRAISESQGSANALALAALAARQGGDEASARRFLTDALARDPECDLARKMTTAGR